VKIRKGTAYAVGALVVVLLVLFGVVIYVLGGFKNLWTVATGGMVDAEAKASQSPACLYRAAVNGRQRGRSYDQWAAADPKCAAVVDRSVYDSLGGGS